MISELDGEAPMNGVLGRILKKPIYKLCPFRIKGKLEA